MCRRCGTYVRTGDDMESMAWQETPYTIPLILAVLALVISALYVWQRHRVAAARTLALVLLSGGGWLLGYALELAGADLHTKVFWYRTELLSVITASMAWLVFTLQYTRHENWVTRRNLMLLSIIPALTAVLVFTNEYHRLVWTHAELNTEGSFAVSDYVHGMWFWVHSAYSYTLVLCGSILIVKLLIRSQRLYRWQISVLLLAACFPVLLSVLNMVGVYTLLYPRVAILLFPLVSLAIALSIFRFRLADIVPVARGAVVDGMIDGVLVLDSQNRIVDVNPIVQQLMDRPASELLGQVVEKVWPAWDIEIDHLHGESEEEIVVDQENGQHIYDVRISPLTDWRGDLISRVVVLRDITERKQAEALIQESEEKFRTIFEHASDEMVFLDTNGKIVDINRKSEEIFGYNRDEIIGRSFAELEALDTEYKDVAADLFKNVVIQGIPIPDQLIELELKHKDGHKVFAEVSHRLIKKKGRVEGILAILRDVTERKQTEEKLKASLKEKEVLLREIHHRVKNNLQVVSSLLKLQSSYTKDTQYMEMLKESQNRIRSMALIHENLYKSEDLASVDFKEYISALVCQLVQSYGVSKERATVTTEVGDVFLGVDAAIYCGLIINELVSNSLKHAFPDRKGEITVALCSLDDSIELIVSDTGVGIPEDIDFRNTETLGLRLVTILAEGQLEGEITLDRSEGTAFHIAFREKNKKIKEAKQKR